MRKAIDWSAVKARLRINQQAVDEALNQDAARVAAVFAKRAERLARPRAAADDADSGLHVLGFMLGHERCAVEIAEVSEVLPMGKFTAVPAAPEELCGVINLRGEILPVVDLGRVLELPPEPEAVPGYVLVLRRMEVGLRVDQVSRIRRLAHAEVDPEMPITGGQAKRYLKAIARDATLILSMESVLTHPVFQTV